MNIKELLKESSNLSSNQNSKPQLQSFTRAVNTLIYRDLVATQTTRQPLSALYGLRYKNPDNDMSYTSAATYSGQYGNRAKIEEVSAKTYVKGDIFKYENIVYEVGENIEIKNIQNDVYEAAMKGDIRLASDAGNADEMEYADIQNINFELDKWQVPVKTRKFKTSITVEAAQDLEHTTANAENVIDDFLSTMISEEINKDIMHKLITVSKRFEVEGTSNKGFIDLSGEDYKNPLMGYKLIRILGEMAAVAASKTGFSCNWVLASSRVSGILASTGLGKPRTETSDGFLEKANLDLYTDTTCPFDYMIAGIKLQSPSRKNRLETVGSLYYSPYEHYEDVGNIVFAVDPESLQPSIMMMSRYSLSVNPYTISKEDESKESAHIIKGDDWTNLRGRSDMSMFLGIKLPNYINSNED